MLRETHIVEPKNVCIYTWRGGGRASEKCTVCTDSFPIIIIILLMKLTYRPPKESGTLVTFVSMLVTLYCTCQ